VERDDVAGREQLAKADELDAVLYDLVDGLTAAAVALAAYLPDTAPRILRALGQSEALAWERVRQGTAEEARGIVATAPLFPRIEADAPVA
jgi:methionyl-tRNA synthetase